jgi:predicted AAA+ superfamily ATPase
LFEGLVASEILKSQVKHGPSRELYYFRDQQGLEVDFLLPVTNARLWLIEAQAGKTVHPRMAAPLIFLERVLGEKSRRLHVIHRASRLSVATSVIARGVEALDVERFSKELVRGRVPHP